MKIIIKVSPEIIIKSKPVRRKTIQLLTNNIWCFLSGYKWKIKIHTLWDRIDIEFIDIPEKEKKDIIKILSFIPWIYNFYLVEDHDFINLEDVFIKTKDCFLQKINGKSFVVRVERSWTHNFTSVDAEKFLWSLFLENSPTSKVNLKNPEETIKIEIKDLKFFAIHEKYVGISGYPVWFQWKVLSLISGWFDSSVSTYLSMKRWCEVDFLFFNLWGSAHEIWVKQVTYYLWKTFSPNYKAIFYTVNFEWIIKELLTKINHKYRWVILKRLMLRCASEIWQKSHYALIKWDSLWQVSSQTLINMNLVDKSSSILTLRPLITSDKQEIIDVSKKIWTYNFACNMPEYCGVISDNPSTRAKEIDVLKEENLIDENLIIETINTKKFEKITDVLKDDLEELQEWLEISYIPWENEVIIDLRETDKIKKAPLVIQKTSILNIQFFDINSKFIELDKEKTYLFYCDKWVLSKLHALYLKEKWFTNIKIYRPLVSDSCNI